MKKEHIYTMSQDNLQKSEAIYLIRVAIERGYLTLAEAMLTDLEQQHSKGLGAISIELHTAKKKYYHAIFNN